MEAWLERLNVLLKGYNPENMWNIDETGCLYGALPEKTLVEQNRECRGGEKVSFFSITKWLIHAPLLT